MVDILGKQSRRCGLAVGATALCFALAVLGPSARSQSAEEPRYAPGGDLLLPNGFDTWVFVGSNLGLPCAPPATHGGVRRRLRSISSTHLHFAIDTLRRKRDELNEDYAFTRIQTTTSLISISPSPPCQLKLICAVCDGCKRFAGITSCTL